MISISTIDQKKKKQIINESVRICVECGNISVKIENFGLYCKDCNTKFFTKENS